MTATFYAICVFLPPDFSEAEGGLFREERSAMSDLMIVALIVGLSALTWGLLRLCDRLQGGA